MVRIPPSFPLPSADILTIAMQKVNIQCNNEMINRAYEPISLDDLESVIRILVEYIISHNRVYKKCFKALYKPKFLIIYFAKISSNFRLKTKILLPP